MNKITERFHFAVGSISGRAGDVSVVLSTLPGPGDCLVKWDAGDGVPADVREFVTRYATEQLEQYVRLHPELGVEVIIIGVGIDPIRHNEYDRATFNAIRIALVKLNLPDLLHYKDPTPEELAEDGFA